MCLRNEATTTVARWVEESTRSAGDDTLRDLQMVCYLVEAGIYGVWRDAVGWWFGICSPDWHAAMRCHSIS